jgi:hypothetical protein
MKQPVKKTRLAQMVHNRLVEVQKSEAEVAAIYGWSKQSLNTWKRGVAPRKQNFASLAKFLGITVRQVEELVAEAAESSGSTKLPDMGAPVMGKGEDDTAIMDRFASGYAKPSVAGCYAVRLGGRHYWVNPRLKPQDGQTVLVRTDEVGKLMTWPAETGDGVEAHVVVLREMV